MSGPGRRQIDYDEAQERDAASDRQDERRERFQPIDEPLPDYPVSVAPKTPIPQTPGLLRDIAGLLRSFNSPKHAALCEQWAEELESKS